MCTILTIDREHFQYYSSEFLAQLDEDARYNSDGFSALVLGEDAENASIIRAMKYKTFKAQLMATLLGGAWERVWIHCRMATTNFVNVAGTHAFIGAQYAVFHNGILRNKEAYYYNVDSMLIADKLEWEEHSSVMKYLLTEPYANVFIVDVETGEYSVSRSITGSLYTDGYGNYSTNKIAGVIDKKVGAYEQFEHAGCVLQYTPKLEGADALLNEAGVDEIETLKAQEDVWSPAPVAAEDASELEQRFQDLEAILAGDPDDYEAWDEYNELLAQQTIKVAR